MHSLGYVHEEVRLRNVGIDENNNVSLLYYPSSKKYALPGKVNSAISDVI